MIPLGQHPHPTHVVAHLSDPHLLADGARQYGVVDPEAGLRLALERLGDLDPRPDVLVFTGDLADRGEPAAYARLRALVEPAARSLGAEVVWTMGNHDDRAAWSAGLLDDDATDPALPRDRVHEVRGLRIVALDSTVPGYHHGALDDAQLAWLAEVLATPAEHGTVLALHHPPIPVPMLPAAALIELHDQDRLAAVVAGSDVRVVIGGHFHYTSVSTFAGVPVSVASATCYTSDPLPHDRLISGVDAHQAFTMLHLYADRVVHTVVPVPRGPEVSGHPASWGALLEQLEPQERHDLVSRKDSALNTGALDLPPE
ncbi:phosphodiesterase [Nocardioides sp.]|uniref:phosphodiesterase n=1 Tax=Nocardioides sp. TaxID=35761 RepID=UPI003513DC59